MCRFAYSDKSHRPRFSFTPMRQAEPFLFMTFLPYLRQFFGSRTPSASSAAPRIIHIGC
jgi:hypothetical protein